MITLEEFKQKILNDISNELHLSQEELQQNIVYQSFTPTQIADYTTYFADIIVKDYSPNGHAAILYESQYSEISGYNFNRYSLTIEMVKALSTLD